MIEYTNIGELIENVDKKNEDFSLFLPNNFDYLESESKCLIVDNKYGEIEFKKISNVKYVDYIVIGTVQDVIDSLYQQIKNPSLKQKIDALNFYLENDAFIDIHS